MKLQGKGPRVHPAPFLLHLCWSWEHGEHPSYRQNIWLKGLGKRWSCYWQRFQMGDVTLQALQSSSSSSECTSNEEIVLCNARNHLCGMEGPIPGWLKGFHYPYSTESTDFWGRGLAANAEYSMLRKVKKEKDCSLSAAVGSLNVCGSLWPCKIIIHSYVKAQSKIPIL